MFSAIKSAFTTEPTPQTVDPLEFNIRKIPVAESRRLAVEAWDVAQPGDDTGLSALKSMLNSVGLDLAVLDGKFVTKDGVAYITTKDKKPVAMLRAFHRYGLIKTYAKDGVDERGTYGHYIEIRQKGDKEVYGPVYNDALNVVTVWASGKSGGKKRRAKTYKKKRVSRKTRRHAR